MFEVKKRKGINSLNIKSIGGEFQLIGKLLNLVPKHHIDLIKGVGDDAAVIKLNEKFLTLVTTDTLVENTHFKKEWFSASQIGVKAVECNISDIAAMGGKPTFIFTSLILPDNIDVAWLKDLYKGLSCSCSKYDLILAGGDTTKGKYFAINIMLLGNVIPEKLCLRGQAKPGDIIAVTGYLGGSFAGLKLLLSGKKPSKYLLKKYLEPKCKLSEALSISPFVNAMIDISDGLSSEICHICNNSNTGAEIYELKLPIHDEVKSVAKMYNMKSSNFAMKGGEDLELLFSIPPNKLEKLNKTGIPYYIIGKITESKKGKTIINKSGKVREIVPKGYNHFT